MTDPDQAARLAAIRARRGQAPAEMPVTAAPPAPAVTAPAAAAAPAARTMSRGQQRVAAGARILATGLTASGVFGITTAIAAANQPKPVAYTPPAATAPVQDPAAVTGTTLAPVVTVPGSVVENVVLTIPPVGGAAAPAATAAPAAAAPAAPAAGGGQAATPNPAAAPAPTPAPTPPPTTAAPVTAPPATTCTTNASGKCK